MPETHPHKSAANTKSSTARRFTLRPPGETPKPTIRKNSRAAAVQTMSENYLVVTDHETLHLACDQLRQAEAIGADCETTELDPHDGDLRLLQLSVPNQTFIFDFHKLPPNPDTYRPVKLLLEDTRRKVISHNSKFEQKWLKHKLGIELQTIFDTQLAGTLIDYSVSHNLENTAKKYLNLTLDKSLQTSNWQGELSEEQLQYAARDAQVLIPLREAMIPHLVQNGLVRVAQLEFEAVAVLADIELNGIFIDREMWASHLALVLHQHEIISRELQQILAAGARQTTLFGETDINLNSHPQILSALKQMGVPLESATRENVLLPLKDEYPVVAKLLDYRGVEKNVSGYGQNWLDSIKISTDRVHPDFTQIGAPTGRTSCSNPNVQQVPTTKEYRQCFRAPAGRSLVITDYSQIELRILAQLSQDPGLLHAFRSGADLHRMTASHVFNVPPDQVAKEQRDFAKRLNFGVVYGIGAQRLSNMTGTPLEEAEATLTKYFATYRQLDEHLRAAAQDAVNNRSCRTMSGRLVRYNFDPSDRQAVSSVRRQGRNAPIQGTGADIFKRSLRLVYDALRGTSAQIVNIIHDEIVVECGQDDAQAISEIVSAKMTEAATEYITDVPMLAEPAICKEWVKG